MRRKIKLLIVEDSEDERVFMKEGFLQSGLYEIVGEAANGDEMIKLLNGPPLLVPEVILSDLNMPGKNGYDVIRDIKSNSALSHIPVIILTTAPIKPYAERCKELGACAYYTKPDTFLEYKLFGEKIYLDMRSCIENNRVDIRAANVKFPIVQRFLSGYQEAAAFFRQRLQVMICVIQQAKC